MVKVTLVDEAETRPKRRIGFLAGRFSVLDDFDQMYAHGIVCLFEAAPE